MISTKQLHYALAVEKTLHFKKAADNCYISQSALSTAINEMENRLGVLIFERDNKKVLVTPAGREILNRARRIMIQVNELQHISESWKTPLSYPISIGIIPTIAPFLLPSLFSTLNSQFPEAQIKIVEEQSHVLVEMVKCGDIDTAILAMPFPCDDLQIIDFWEEDFYWIALKDDVQKNQTEIKSAELIDQKLMLLSEGHCLSDHIMSVCSLQELSSNHSFSAMSLNTLVQMVIGKIGTTLIPKMALDQLITQNDNLSAVHLDETSPHRRLAFIIRPNYIGKASIEALIDTCKVALTTHS